MPPPVRTPGEWTLNPEGHFLELDIAMRQLIAINASEEHLEGCARELIAAAVEASKAESKMGVGSSGATKGRR